MDRLTLAPHRPDIGSMPIAGSLRLLFLYNVAEAIRLEKLQSILGVQGSERAPSFAHPTPEYVRFERAPLIEPVNIADGERVDARVKYYDYGIVTIELAVRFESEWGSLIQRLGRRLDAPEFDAQARDILESAMRRAAPALVKPYDTWLDEDYYVVELDHPKTGPAANASETLASHGQEIAQLVRGEEAPLSDGERQEVLQSSLSYSTTDLLVAGWTGAVIYDTPEGAEATIQLLEYANTQLLEFRHYDSVLTRLLEEVYASLEHKKGMLYAWHLSREAARLNTLRLDIMELVEKTDNALKFVGDMFYARLHRLAAAKIGVPDYRNLVEQKLRTAGELYKFMMDRFDQSRNFVLELTIVIILVIDLWFLFRGAY